MGLIATPEQAELAQVVARFLGENSPLSAVRTVAGSPDGYDRELWARLNGELGLGGLAIAEKRGGSGFGVTELAVAVQECGAALLPGPLLGSACFCGLVLDAAGDEEVLPGVAAGTTIAALVHDPSVAVSDGRATGTATGVLDGMTADVFIVVTESGVYAVGATGLEVTRSALKTLDLTRRQAAVQFGGAPATRLGSAQDAAAGLDRATVVLAAEQLGVLRRSLDMAVAYARQREQFGRLIGSFQAVKHGLADVYTSYELAIGAVAYAAWAADHQPGDLPVAASVASAYLSPQAFEAAFQMIQYHGGIGYTWEHDAHLYYKRAKTNQTLLGGTGPHLDRIADYLLQPG
jgi:alkylation response protein AidB-like acyl-CoA dehydrogenase